MRTQHAKALILAALAGAAGLSSAESALASDPLEYPDNGSAAFSRGGAWLGVANEPIAAHYNPAALATQASGFSIEQQLNFPKTCYARRGPNNSYTGPIASSTTTLPDGTTAPTTIYLPVCSERGSFPNTIPSISLAWRATKKLGIGVAIVPPATYGTADGQFPLMTRGYNLTSRQYVQVAAPYRYQQLQQLSTIIYPTVGFGYELFKHFRVGAAFVSGIAVINTTQMGYSNLNDKDSDALGDHVDDDALSNLRTKDLFVPGVIVSFHWSVLPQLDVSAWARYMDAIRTSSADFSLAVGVFENGQPTPQCTNPNLGACAGSAAVNTAANNPPIKNALTSFKYPIPPEVRIGARFHQPRSKSRFVFADGGEARDPLHDDLFDVEVDGSYSMNSAADTITVRFQQSGGAGTVNTIPTGVSLPPDADRYLGYQDSFGLRVGGQWNVIADKLGLRAGGWYESRSQDPAWLTIQPVGAARWGFGGGIVLRQDFIDISFGYQRHESAGLDNHGNGALKAAAGTGTGDLCNGGAFNTSCDAGLTARDKTQFRTVHAINGGHVTFSADVFTIGGTVRF